MILYQALSAYQILECIVHRQIFHKDDKSILILGTYVKERMPRYYELETRHFFDEVYLFRFGGYRGSEQEIISQVEEEFRRSIPYRPEEFETILAAGIHTYLEVFFLSRGISFEMFEDGSGALSRPEILAGIHRKSAPDRYRLIDSYGLYDHSSSGITKKYCDLSAQKEGFKDPLAVDFRVLDAFKKLPFGQQEEIRHIFEIPTVHGEEEEVLLLTQQFANLGQLSFDGQIEIYRHLFDYYLEGRRVLIKPHPDDILYYSFLFPGARVIPGTFPSELLEAAFDRLPGTICTVSSTGVNQISSHFRHRLIWNAAYEETYRYDALYYMALRLAGHLGVKRILTRGVNLVQLKNLAAFSLKHRGMELLEDGEQERKKENSLLLVGDGQDEKRPVCSPGGTDGLLGILFLNETGKYPLYTYGCREQFLEMVPVTVLQKNREHTMYFYSENKEVKEMTETFRCKKELSSCEDTIRIQELTPEGMRIRMLEGILAATEQRLLAYIESEKELKKELKKWKEAGEKKEWN